MAGAVGCIFYNNVEGALRPKATGPGINIFGHGISLKQGETLLEQLEAAPDKSINIVYSDKKGVFANEMANQISTFSSWGLGPELELKPDIAGPGGYIYSTVPVPLLSRMYHDNASHPCHCGSTNTAAISRKFRSAKARFLPCLERPWQHHILPAAQR